MASHPLVARHDRWRRDHQRMVGVNAGLLQLRAVSTAADVIRGGGKSRIRNFKLIINLRILVGIGGTQTYKVVGLRPVVHLRGRALVGEARVDLAQVAHQITQIHLLVGVRRFRLFNN